jgi:ribonuclease R
MADDYYRFVESAHTLRGENTRKIYRLGDRVHVQVVRVDLDRRQIDLGLVEILDAVRADEHKRGPRRSQVRMKKDARRSRPGRGERERKRGRKRR